MSKDFKYYKLTPFKWFILENFPFIEADFDALTNYELFCKIGKEMNKIIDATNLSGEQVEALTTLVNNFIEDLDIQTEVNNKLDEMAQDGTLAEIINQEIFTELSTKVNTMYPIVNRLANRKIILIGDSYGVSTPDRTIPWPQYIINRLGLTINQNAFVSCKASCGLIGDPNLTPSGDYTFLKLLQDLDNTIADKESITDIIICGGHNDRSYTYAQLAPYMLALSNYIKSNYPNAKASLNWISWSNKASYLDLYANGIFKYKTLANTYGMYYIPNIENSFHYTEWLIDAVHPNNEGSEKIGQTIINYIVGGVGAEIISGRQNTVITGSNGFSVDSGYKCTTELLHDVIQLYLNANFRIADGLEFTCNGNFVEIGELSNSFLSGNNDNIVNCQAMINANGTIYNLDGLIKISGQKIYFACFQKQNNSTTDLSFTMTMLFIQKQNFLIPTTAN